MHVSLLVATRNRLSSLRRCVAAVTGLQVPEGSSLELIVVDNVSRDGTPEWLASLPAELAPGVRLLALADPRPGKSRALNLGLAHATGQALAFIDDDVEVDPGWLAGLESGFATGAQALQGGIRLHLPGARPWWMTPRVEAILAATTLWTGRTPVTSMIGSNMAVLRLDGVPAWCEELGPGVPDYPFGEDSDWSARALASRRGRFWPEMSCAHVLEGRIRVDEICRRQFWSGLNTVIYAADRGALYRATVAALPRELARLAWHLLRGRPAQAMDAVWTLARFAGVFSGLLGRGRRHPRWPAARAAAPAAPG